MPFERIEIFSINFNLRENEGKASKPFRLTRKGGKKEKKKKQDSIGQNIIVQK